MKIDRINYLAVGVFVLAMFALLLVVLYRLTGARGATDTYYAWFDNISGLSRSSPVSYEGYPVGHIATIEPVQTDGATGYKIAVELQRGWKIPRDSVARITAFSLLSEFVVDIREGSSKDHLRPGDTLQGLQGGDFYSALNDVAADVSDITAHGLKPLLEKLTTRVPALLDDFQALLTKLDGSAGALRQLLSQDNQKHVASLLKNADAASANLLQLSGDVNATRAHLDKLLSDTGALLNDSRPDLRASVVQLRDALEMVSENIDAIMRNTEGTSRNMYELSRQLRQNPGLLLGTTPPRDDGNAGAPPR